MTIMDDDVRVDEGQTARLECRPASTANVARIEWTRTDGARMDSRSVYSYLVNI